MHLRGRRYKGKSPSHPLKSSVNLKPLLRIQSTYKEREKAGGGVIKYQNFNLTAQHETRDKNRKCQLPGMRHNNF